MQNLFTVFVVAFALQALPIPSDHDLAQPEQTQVPAAPCVTTPTNGNPSANHPTFKLPSGLRHKIAATTGITLPDVPINSTPPANTKSAPCIPQAASQKSAQPSQSPALKLPPDVTATLHCNPVTPSTKDVSGRPTTLTLPDAHDFAAPKPGDFEVDSVLPDLAAKTPCYLVKVNPKTGKSFVSQ